MEDKQRIERIKNMDVIEDMQIMEDKGDYEDLHGFGGHLESGGKEGQEVMEGGEEIANIDVVDDMEHNQRVCQHS